MGQPRDAEKFVQASFWGLEPGKKSEKPDYALVNLLFIVFIILTPFYLIQAAIRKLLKK